MQATVSHPMNFSVPLNHPTQTQSGASLALIHASGADAGSFLQGQLTQDVLLMNESEARLAAWCSAKGRVLVSMLVYKTSPQDFFLILSADLLAHTLKRLKMFVLRAKCSLNDVSDQYEITGVVGLPAVALNLGAFSAVSMPAISLKPLEKVIQLAPAWHGGQAVARALRIAPKAPNAQATAASQSTVAAAIDDAAPNQLLTESPTQSLTPMLAVWSALEISTGIARITAPLSEALVPQMLNYESVGGVNFKKGCYPGQEVVARSQFRGSLKRRAYIVRCAAPLQAGQEVLIADEPDQPCGIVVQAAPEPWTEVTSHASGHAAGLWTAIVSMQISAAGADLRIGSASGAALQVQTLPYTLLEDI